MAMAAQDAYERQRVNVAVAWAVAASLCVAFAVFGFDGVMRGRAASTDSAVFQGLVSGLIGVDASAKDTVTVSAVVFNAFAATVLALLSYYAAHVTVRTDWHRSVDYAGSLATVVAAAIATGPALARIAQIMSVTRSAALAVFLSATLVAVMAAYIQYAASGRITVALARLLITAAVIIALSIIAVVIFAIPAPVIAAACSVGGAWYVHAQANVILRVPDRYLIEWRRYMSQRWTVRGAVPENSRPLYTHDISEDMTIFSAEYTMGLVVGHLYIAAGYVVLCLTMPAEPDLFTTIGFGAYSVLLPCYLLLRPRTAGSALERMLMRSCAVLLPAAALITLTNHGDWRWLVTWVVFGLIAVGIVIAAATLAVSGGFKSLMLSRIGDWIAAGSLALMGPAAFLASNAMDMIRGFMS